VERPHIGRLREPEAEVEGGGIAGRLLRAGQRELEAGRISDLDEIVQAQGFGEAEPGGIERHGPVGVRHGQVQVVQGRHAANVPNRV
jgi:hypothetical protein